MEQYLCQKDLFKFVIAVCSHANIHSGFFFQIHEIVNIYRYHKICFGWYWCNLLIYLFILMLSSLNTGRKLDFSDAMLTANKLG